MKLDNAKRAGRIKLLYMLIPFLLILTTALMYLVFGAKEFIYAVIAGVCLLSFFLGMFYFRFYFISFYAGPDKIRLRYKSLSPFPTQNNSIQIEAHKFHDYSFKTYALGSKKTLTLFMQTPGGIAAYPKTSVSALNGNQIKKILKALDLIKQLNIHNKKSDNPQ